MGDELVDKEVALQVLTEERNHQQKKGKGADS